VENKLIAKKGKFNLYYVETLNTWWGTKVRMGRITTDKGKTYTVDIDDILGRSNWDVINLDWQEEAEEWSKINKAIHDK
jgi:hypothetical protein